MNEKSLLYKVEKEIIDYILNKLENQEITLEQAANIASMTLKAFPEHAEDNKVLRIIENLDDEFEDIAKITLHYIKDYEKQHGKIVQENFLRLWEEKNFSEANKLMKDYIQKKL